MPEIEDQIRRLADTLTAEVEPVTADEARDRADTRRLRRAPARPFAVAAIALVVVAALTMLLLATRSGSSTSVATDAASTAPLTLDGHRNWMLALYNGQHSPSDEELRTRLTPTYLEHVQPEAFRATADLARRDGPWSVLAEVDRRDNLVVTQLVSAGGHQAQLGINIAADGRITGSFIKRAVDCAPVPAELSSLSGPLATRLRWTLDLLNGEDVVSDTQLAATFTPAFIDAVPPDEFRTTTERLRSAAPVALRSFQGEPTPHSLSVRLGGNSGDETEMTLRIEPEEPHRIRELSLRLRSPCTLAR